MTTPHARCEACGVSLPSNAVRCPTCGHQQGAAITVEVGRRRGDGPRDTDGRNHRDLIVLGAVVALVVGALVFVGRDSNGQQAAPAATTTTSTTVRRATSLSSTTTTAPATTTSTTLPALQLGEPSGVKLLVGTDNRFMSLIDLDSGVTSRTVITPGYFVPTAAGIVITTQNGEANFVREPYDEVGVDLGHGDSVHPSALDDRVWLTQYSSSSMTFREVDTSGAVAAGPFTVALAQVIGGVSDGVVVAAPGSIYLIDRSGSIHRIGSGEAIAAGGDSVLATQCDDQLRCGLVVIDALTTKVRMVSGLGDTSAANISIVISPDGTTAAILLTGAAEPSLVLVDLASATVSTLETSAVGSNLTTPSFSRDSRWVFMSTDVQTTAYRVGADDKRVITIGRGQVQILIVV